jgi:hypothetical protein
MNFNNPTHSVKSKKKSAKMTSGVLKSNGLHSSKESNKIYAQSNDYHRL